MAGAAYATLAGASYEIVGAKPNVLTVGPLEYVATAGAAITLLTVGVIATFGAL